MSAPDLEATFDTLRRAFRPEKARGVDAVVQYVLTGEGACEFYGSIRGGGLELQAGRAPKAKVTLTMAVPDFQEMTAGRLGAMAAYTGRRLKVDGSILFAMKLEPIFDFKA